MSGPAFSWRAEPAGVLDVSGRDRTAFLQGLATADFRALAPDRALWSAALSPTGKVLFTFLAAPRGDRIRLLLSPARLERAASHFRKYAVFQDARAEPPAVPLVRFDLYGRGSPPPPEAADAWPGFFETSATWLVPAEERNAAEARLAEGRRIDETEAEWLRIEAGRPADGRDVDESRTPDEAGLGLAVSTSKGCYVGQEIVARMRTYGRLPRRLVRFRFASGPPPPGERLVRAGETGEAGIVTSSVRSPRSGAIGLGYAGRDVEDGTTLEGAETRIAARVERIAPPEESREPA